MTLSQTRPYRVPGEEGGGGEERLRYHVLAAHALVRGEHQLAKCVRILVASPIPLSVLAARDPASRVGEDENRSFEKVIRAWTLRILSGG